MASRSLEPSLAERLVDRYLLVGLACIFHCIVLFLLLYWFERLDHLAPAAVVLPLAILLAGGVLLRRRLELTSEIERQLRELSASPALRISALRRVAGSTPPAAGWNRIVDDAASLESLREIEARLSQALGHTNQRRLEQVLNSLPEGIAVTGPDGKVRFANRALCALLGRGEPATLGDVSIGDLLGLDTDETMASIRDRLQHSRSEAALLVQRGADPAAGVWSMARYPLAADESSDAFVWSVRDVTQQKLAEEARNQFVFTATHELRTPLANIMAYSETLSLSEDIDVERQKQFYNVLHSEALRLSRFIDELLTISQMQAGGLTVARFETDIERLLAEVDEKVEGQVARKGISFAKSLPAKLPKLHADKDKIAAALVNLLANAIKYTPENGQVRLIVEATDETIQFHVEDTGIGIAPDELPKVFEKFYRSSDRRVQDVPGSGIGLAFTQEVARLHGGTLTVQSELDKGSRFTLCLPRVEPQSSAPRQRGQA